MLIMFVSARCFFMPMRPSSFVTCHDRYYTRSTKDYGKIPKFCCVEFNALYKLCVIPMIIETVMRSSVSRVGQG